MREIKAIIQPFMLERVLQALGAVEDLPGLTVSHVMGWGKSRAAGAHERVAEAGHAFAKKTKLEIVVADEQAPRVIAAIVEAARTGRPGDGKIFEVDVRTATKIRTGERGDGAL